MIQFFLFLLLPFLSIAEEDRQEFIVLTEPQSKEFFSTINCVGRLLFYYDKGLCSGVEVDFQNNGFFYKQERGPNWWHYFFEPILVGLPDAGVPFPYTERLAYQLTQDFEERQIQQKLPKIIKKYIHIKPHITDKVKSFYNSNFKDNVVIGVHYRGRKNERIPYNRVSDEIHRYLQENKIKQFRIFISTNEQPFLDSMRMRFATQILSLPGLRSNAKDPTEIKAPYIHGERELMDCLLLTKTNVMIYTSSYLSEWALLFNPELPAIQVTKERNF